MPVISKTARCIMNDVEKNGSVRLYPCAKTFVDKMVADGLVTSSERRGMLVVKAARNDKSTA